MKQNYFIVFDTTEGAYLCLTGQGDSILTFPTERKASDFFELHYQECHARDITWSTSAAMHWLVLKPFIIALDTSLSPVEVVNTLSSQAPDPVVYSLHSLAVRSIKGLKVDLDSCLQYEISKIRIMQGV
jgi:hypothetical protein